MLVYSTSLILPIWKGGPSFHLSSLRLEPPFHPSPGPRDRRRATSSIGACRSVRWVRYSAQDSTSPLHFLNSSPAPPTSEQSTNKQCVCMFDKFPFHFRLQNPLFKLLSSSSDIRTIYKQAVCMHVWQNPIWHSTSKSTSKTLAQAPSTSAQSTNKQCVCMFDKFYLTFDFKPKVSSDVIKNNQRMSIDVYIWFCEMSPQCRMLSSMCYSNFLPCQFACDYLTLQVALHVKF